MQLLLAALTSLTLSIPLDKVISPFGPSTQSVFVKIGKNEAASLGLEQLDVKVEQFMQSFSESDAKMMDFYEGADGVR